MFGPKLGKLVNKGNFHPLEVVRPGSETSSECKLKQESWRDHRLTLVNERRLIRAFICLWHGRGGREPRPTKAVYLLNSINNKNMFLLFHSLDGAVSWIFIFDTHQVADIFMMLSVKSS